MSDLTYLLINMSDLERFDIPGWRRFVRPELGDKLLDGAYIMGKDLDDAGLAVSCTDARAAAIIGGLELLSRRKGKVRCKQVGKLPKSII